MGGYRRVKIDLLKIPDDKDIMICEINVELKNTG